MTIDTGISLKFDANYPVPGINQSSQQFRDNFAIIQNAIENIHAAATDPSSVLQLQTTVSELDSTVSLNLTFTNNSFKLPTGAPADHTPVAGMIRFNDGVEYYDNAAWHPLARAADLPSPSPVYEDGITVRKDGDDVLAVGSEVVSHVPLRLAPMARPQSAKAGTIVYNDATDSFDFFSNNDWKLRVRDAHVFGTLQMETAQVLGSLYVSRNPVASSEVVTLGYLDERLAGWSPEAGGGGSSGGGSGVNLSSVFSDNIELGLSAAYDAVTGKVNLIADDFKINLTGAVTGSATVRHLTDVTITTTSEMIKGITVQSKGVPLGSRETVRTLNFAGDAVEVFQAGDSVTVNLPKGITTQEVRNTIGESVRGTARDPNTNIRTETGITVNYDAQNNVIELGVRDFDITLVGAVSGTARVSKLNSVVLNTTSKFIEGITVRDEGILAGKPSAIRALNFVGDGVRASVLDDTATITFTPAIDANGVRNSVSNLMAGSHNGVDVVYDAANQKIKFSLKPMKLTFTGAIQGAGTINFTGAANDGAVTIVTEASSISAGLEVRDEGSTKGTAVSAINFVGGGVTSAVSIDGHTATVYIPNSPGNEKFILLDEGSANVPNARRLSAGTGISLMDGGPGGSLTISAESDSLLAKSQFLMNGELVGERAIIDVHSTPHVTAVVEDVPPVVNESGDIVIPGKLNLSFYGIQDGWYRKPVIDCGEITDRYGVSVDLGHLGRGIIEAVADMGALPPPPAPVDNLPPSDIMLSSSEIAENSPVGTEIATITGTDPESNYITFSIIDDAQGRFAINGTKLVVAGSLNFEQAASHEITIRATDIHGATFDKSFTITVTDANDAPTDISLSESNVAEDAPVGTIIGVLLASDVDPPAPFTYEIVIDADQKFGIDGDKLVLAAPVDYEVSRTHSVTIRAIDSDGASVDKAFTIFVTNVNETPTDIIISTTSVSEDAEVGSTIALISATDTDGVDTFTFEIADDPDQKFHITGNQLDLASPLNYAEKNSHPVTIRVTDAGGLSITKTFDIEVIEAAVSN